MVYTSHVVRKPIRVMFMGTSSSIVAVAGKGHPLHTSIIHISIAELPFYTHFHCRTSILHPLPLPNFHSTPTSIAKLPFYTHFHCQTSFLHPLPLTNFHSTPTSIAELPFYTHFHSTTTPKFAHVPTSVASSPATHSVRIAQC